MAKFYPTIENIARLKVKPTEGEYYLINYLNEQLDDSFEVFFNPFLDGDRPDFIILKEDVAVFIIEVKDYQLSNYSVDVFNKWSVHSEHRKSRISSPQSQVFSYESNLYYLHLSALGLRNLQNRNFFKLVVPLVYLHKADKNKISVLYEDIENHISQERSTLKVRLKEDKLSLDEYNHEADLLKQRADKVVRDKAMLFGADRVKDLIKKIKGCTKSVLFDDRVYDDFKRRLMPPTHVLNQGRKIQLDKKQMSLVESRVGKEKIKGVAGCGKTTIMVNRAINAYMHHKELVLILTFNITLKNLIKDKISDVLGYRDEQNFAVTNYHQFFNSQIIATEQDLYQLFSDYTSLEEIYKATDIFKDKKVERYQTILIDEVQDFDSEWIKIIRDNFLEPEGEMVLFGDESQNIYGRDEGRADVIVKGFGRWVKLKRSYRTALDSPLNQMFKDYQTNYLLDKYPDTDVLETVPIQIGINFALMKYHLLDENWENEAFNLIQSYIRIYSLNPNDVVILSAHVFPLRRLVKKFTAIEKTHCMFEDYNELAELVSPNIKKEDNQKVVKELMRMPEDTLQGLIDRSENLKRNIERARRTKKNFFYANCGLIKFSTIHSFKGLESKTVFYLMDKRDTREIVYTSITRSVENLIILDLSKGGEYSDFFNREMNGNNTTIETLF